VYSSIHVNFLEVEVKVKELATCLNTTTDTVRYYTRLGFLAPIKSANGYQYFTSKDKSRLKFILSARQLGFSVADLKEILAEADSGRTACPIVRDIIKLRLAETEKQFQAMLKLRERMTTALTSWDKMADKLPTPHSVCHLIGIFDDVDKQPSDKCLNGDTPK
jgi:DNA-binding transcriptional MerR regulator